MIHECLERLQRARMAGQERNREGSAQRVRRGPYIDSVGHPQNGKKGILGISMRGLSIEINDFSPSKPGYAAEYGTWKITSGSGMYEGWTGGGRWASVSAPANYVEWDGFVTQ
jgi:hypothetical protein